jgi:maleylpyruvate isomerase
MDAAQRELSDQIDFATQRLLDDARTIPEADLRAPSLLQGWTRAHVLAHLARNADAMRNLLTGARSGQDRPAYASAQAREADIERGAAISAKDLIADLADSSMALRAIARELPDQAWQVRVRMLDPAPFPAAELLTRRLVEVELHHCDLAAGYSPADWPPAFAAMELTEPMRSQRRDRLRYPPPSAEAEPAWPGRPPPSWKPGQRLPGSWLGTADESRPLATSPDPGATPVAMIAVTYRRRRTPARTRLATRLNSCRIAGVARARVYALLYIIFHDLACALTLQRQLLRSLLA